MPFANLAAEVITPDVWSLPNANTRATLIKTPKSKPKLPTKRLNVLVFGEKGIGKSSLIEHLLINFDREGADAIFEHRNKKSVPFGNICGTETKKITEYPILTDYLRVKLIDCPGYDEVDSIDQSIKKVKQFINCKLIEFSNR